jgi:hypothetical protein
LTEARVCVHPNHHCDKSGDGVVPVQASSHLGGSLISGGGNIVNGKIFLIFLVENGSIQNMIKDCYPSLHQNGECRCPRGGLVTQKL